MHMKQFIEEFKKFIDRGNVIDLAVGMVVGSAFTNIVNSLVNDIIMPVIGRIIGGFDFTDIKIPLGGDSFIMIGDFIQNVIDFLIIAFVVFLVVRSLNNFEELKKQLKHEEEKKEEKPKEEVPEDIKLLRSIEKELKKANKK